VLRQSSRILRRKRRSTGRRHLVRCARVGRRAAAELHAGAHRPHRPPATALERRPAAARCVRRL